MNYVELFLRQKDFTFKKELVECKLIGKPFKKSYKKIVREYQKISFKHPFYNKTVEGTIPAYIIY